MAANPWDDLNQFGDEANRWLRDHGVDLKQSLQTGRTALNAAVQAGRDLISQAPPEVQALSSGVLGVLGATPPSQRQHSLGPGQNRPSANLHVAAVPSRPSRPAKSWSIDDGLASIGDGLREAAMQQDTAVRGAANVLTLGGANHFAAGMDALFGGGLDHWQQRYEADLAEQQARDRYDAVNRPIAQAIGQGLGTLAGVGLLGPTDAAVAMAPRLAGAARLTGREVAALLGGGAATNMGVQTLSDAATGRRLSFANEAGAAIGGVAGTAALPLGPARAAAIGGGTTSAVQDWLNGRPFSMDRAGEDAITSGVLGRLLHGLGTSWSDNLSRSAKGRLGEFMGDVRSTINGQLREQGSKARDQIPESGVYWYPDGRSGSTRFEDKFGYWARLTRNQLLAQAALGKDFVLNHFTPDDVGSLVSLPAAAIGPSVVSGPSTVSADPPDWSSFALPRLLPDDDPLAPR